MIAYKHTQFGWMTFSPMMVVIVVFAMTRDVSMVWPLVLIGILVFSLFGTLTVIVDDVSVSCRFGIGIIRKRVLLSDIEVAVPVRNEWYFGWGIRRTPAGWLYNVSGLQAVDLTLKNGRHVRIGTDEPARLREALARFVPTSTDPSVATKAIDAGFAWKRRLVLISAAVIPAALAVIFYLHMQPPSVHIDAQRFSIRSVFYQDEFPLIAIKELSLQDSIPRVVRRTNGFALGGTLRGSFRLEVLGAADLYINQRTPPFIVLKTTRGFVIFNFKDSGQTYRTYTQLVSLTRATPRRP